MAQFKFLAKQGLQKIVEGAVDAETRDAAVAKILQMGFTPLDVTQGTAMIVSPSKGVSAWRQALLERVTSSEITLFTRLAADLIGAGVPLFKTLQNLERQTKPSYFKNVVGQLCVMVQDGAALSLALSQFPKVFSSFYVHIVKAGEAGGNLNDVLERLADFLEEDQAIRVQVRLSLIYPGLILIVGGLTIFVILTWVIPRIAVVFEDFGADLPLVTVGLMEVSHFFAKFWMVMAAGIALIVFSIRKFSSSPDGKWRLDRIVLKIPFIGTLQKDADLGRFARTIGMMLDNGVGVISALQSAASVLENEVLHRAVNKIEAAVTNGESLTNSFSKARFFPKPP